jgi:hypothetical protein
LITKSRVEFAPLSLGAGRRRTNCRSMRSTVARPSESMHTESTTARTPPLRIQKICSVRLVPGVSLPGSRRSTIDSEVSRPSHGTGSLGARDESATTMT